MSPTFRTLNLDNHTRNNLKNFWYGGIAHPQLEKAVCSQLTITGFITTRQRPISSRSSRVNRREKLQGVCQSTNSGGQVFGKRAIQSTWKTFTRKEEPTTNVVPAYWTGPKTIWRETATFGQEKAFFPRKYKGGHVHSGLGSLIRAMSCSLFCHTLQI